MNLSKPIKTPTQPAVHVDAPEVMYITGLAFLFSGAWLYLGLGPALMLAGGALLLTATLEAHHVV